MLSYRCLASLGELPCRNGFAEGGFCDTLQALRAQKALVLLNGFSNRVIARRDNPDCLRELSGKPLLKRLPQFFHVGVGSEGMRAKRAVQETLPYLKYVILMVVPRLGAANLHIPDALLLRLSDGFPDDL